MEASLRSCEQQAHDNGRGFARPGCRSCDRVFTSVRAFDMHRRGEHGEGRYCVSPTPEAGLRLTSEGYWEVAS